MIFDPAVPMPQVIHPDAAMSQTVVRRSAQGTFVLQAEINGVSIPMIFDTGASYVALRAEDAARAGIDLNALVYSARAQTANGQTTFAPVTIRTISAGGITRRNVPAMVSRPGQLGVSLLGQSFTSRLSGTKLERDQLILQGD